MNKVTVGIIGAGRIGQLHAENILNSNKLKLKSMADIDIDHLKGSYYEKQVPIITSNPLELIMDKDIDAVIICSITDTHAGFIIQAAREGKHIFCEKPISFNISETVEVIKVVKETGVKFQVGFNRRFDKHFRKVYEIVKSEKIGNPHIIKVTSRDSEPPPEKYIYKSGGMFMDMTIHDFDMVRYLSNYEVTEVSVKASSLVDPMFEKHEDVDTAIVTLRFEDNSMAVIDNSRQAVYGYDQRIEVFGEKGVVSVDNELNTNVQIATKNNISLDHPKYFFLERYQDAYVAEIDDFADAIRQDKPVSCSVEDGYMAELVALAAKKSHEENRTVLISELQDCSLK